MPRDRWYVGGYAAARLLIVTSAGIRLDEGALVGRQRGGREQRGS
jgi:hypothetical protein